MKLAQVALLDVNNIAGESFQEALHKEFGSEKTFFFKCDVESEEQIKGNGHSQLHSSSWNPKGLIY